MFFPLISFFCPLAPSIPNSFVSDVIGKAKHTLHKLGPCQNFE